MVVNFPGLEKDLKNQIEREDMKGGGAISIYCDEIQGENSKTSKEKVQATYERMRIRHQTTRFYCSNTEKR